MSAAFKNIRSSGIKYGIAGGSTIVAFLALIYYLGNSILDPSLSLVLSLVILLFVVFALIEYRQHDKETRFWKNMSIGIIIYLIIGIFSSVFVYVIVSRDREVMQNYIDNRIEMMNENKSTFVDRFDEETFDETLEGVRKTQPHHLAIDRLMRDWMSGLFVTILISAIFHFIYNKKVFTNPKSN